MSKKYYAVARGKTTGVFHSWSQCKEQVHGFSGAVHKSFRRLDQAQAWLDEKSQSKTLPREAKKKTDISKGTKTAAEQTERLSQWAEKAAIDLSAILVHEAQAGNDVKGLTEKILECANTTGAADSVRATSDEDLLERQVRPGQMNRHGCVKPITNPYKKPVKKPVEDQRNCRPTMNICNTPNPYKRQIPPAMDNSQTNVCATPIKNLYKNKPVRAAMDSGQSNQKPTQCVTPNPYKSKPVRSAIGQAKPTMNGYRTPIMNPYKKPVRLDAGQRNLQHTMHGCVTPTTNPCKMNRKYQVVPCATQGDGDSFTTPSNKMKVGDFLQMDRRLATPVSTLKEAKRIRAVETFTSSLLKVSVETYVEAGASEWKGEQLWRDLCRQLAIPVSLCQVQDSYQDPRTHMRIRKSLVVEEARESIARPLQQRWEPTEKGIAPLPEANNPETMQFLLEAICIGKSQPTATVLMTLHRPFPENPNQKPNWFTTKEKQHLMPGEVFECVDVANKQVMLAVVQPCDPDRITKDMNFDVEVATYQGCRVGVTYRCTPIGNILSFERQLVALGRNPKHIAFLGSLLGGETDSSRDDTIKGITQSSVTPYVKSESVGSTNDSSVLLERMKLRNLNDTQERAVSSFLSAPTGSISIIQGYVSNHTVRFMRLTVSLTLHDSPPGTGKTTLLVSTIARLVSSEGQRILVCAPTNKAVSVLAMRFWEAAEDAGIRISLVGDEHKLLEDSDGQNSPLYPFYIYKWLDVIKKEYAQIRDSCTGRKRTNEPRLTAEQMWKQSIVLRDRLIGSLVDLPVCFLEKLEELCEALKSCVCTFHSLSASVAALASSICKEMDKFPKNEVQVQVLNSAHVIFSTLCSSACKALTLSSSVDALIVDEAAAATEPELYIPFQHRPSKLLIVGDPKQLPATVISDRASKLGLAVSLHERLMDKCDHPYFMLDVQYRMHPEISQFPSVFYDGKIFNGKNVLKSKNEGIPVLLYGRPYVFLQVNGAERETKSGSLYNNEEATAIVSLVARFRESHNSKWCSASDHLRIITFYKAQVALIKKKLTENGMKDVLVSTVDASQGSEADVVLVSFVRAGCTPGFLTDDRRMNVALTRARHHMVCVGNVLKFPSMKKADKLWSLSRDAVKRQLVRSQTQSFGLDA